MDTTASSFTLRKNAKRAAEAMIRKGTAPAVDYGIKPSDDGRFEIVWKSAKTASTTDEVETVFDFRPPRARGRAHALREGKCWRFQSTPATRHGTLRDYAPCGSTHSERCDR